MFSDADGEAAVRLARAAVEGRVRVPPRDGEVPPILLNPGGVFVTLSTYPERELRGCIGFPQPRYPLHRAVILAARSACEDPRFNPVTPGEAQGLLVEVSLLSVPEAIVVSDPREYLRTVRIGRDGLIISQGPFSGLLLPQVPVEYRWSVEEYLSHACMKAGLMPDAWFEDGVRIHRFTAEVFGEEEPRGRVIRRVLEAGHVAP